MMAVCKAVDLARYIVGKYAEEGRPVTNLHLQKMLFFAQASYCRASKGDLLFDDEFEAWPYGPVIPSVYDEYSVCGARPIGGRKCENPCGGESGLVDAILDILRDKDA